MSAPVQYVVDGDTVPFFFDTFDGGTGASITLTGLAATDIEIYKGTSMTQRSSDNGYSLIDTDGIDLDGITGIHGVSVDFSDNSDAGFYATDEWYHIVVSSVTIDGQTVSFVLAKVYIMTATRGLAGTALPAAAADAAGGLPISDAGGLDLDTMNTNVSSILTDTGTTLDNFVDDLETRLGTPSDLGGGATIADNLSDMAGATFSTSTDSQEAIRNHIGNGSNLTEAGGDGDHLTNVSLAAGALDSTSHAVSSINAIRDAILADSTAFNGADIASILTKVNLLPEGFAKNTSARIKFIGLDSTDHISPITGRTWSGSRLIDAGTWASVTGTFSEPATANGGYIFSASAADLNGDDILFRFTATGADDVFIFVKTVA
jgi:hypothetical protein